MTARAPAPALAFALAFSVVACAVPRSAVTTALDDDAVTIASFNFDESRLLAEIYAHILETRGIRVERQLDLGPRELVEPALELGLVELVPEYSGSLLGFLAGQASSDPRETAERLEMALRVRGLTALDRARAQNRNVFVVTSALADQLDLDTISDLAEIDGLVLGAPPECPQRRLCLPGLEDVYGIRFAGFVPLDPSGPLTADALRRGVVDVALLFSTSPEILRLGFVTLEDDRGLQPAENVVPVVHREVLPKFGPGLRAALEAVSDALTTQELRALNARLSQGTDAAVVAREWLTEHGLVSGPG